MDRKPTECRPAPAHMVGFSQAAAEIGVASRTLERWLRKGACPVPTRFGNARYFERHEVDALRSALSASPPDTDGRPPTLTEILLHA